MRCGQARVATGLEEQTKLEQQLREQKHHTDRTLKEVDGLTQKVSKLQAELEDQARHAAHTQPVCCAHPPPLTLTPRDNTCLTRDVGRCGEMWGDVGR